MIRILQPRGTYFVRAGKFNARNFSASSATMTGMAGASKKTPPIVKSIEDEVQDSNRKHGDSVMVKRVGSKGWGVFATKNFSQGDLCFSANAIGTYSERTSHTVQTSWTTHTLMDLPGRFINHCCTANVGIVDNDAGAFDFKAIHQISIGEELVWDYEASEYEISCDFDCVCDRSPRCRGNLKGFKHNGSIIKEQYGEKYIASYLKRRGFP